MEFEMRYKSFPKIVQKFLNEYDVQKIKEYMFTNDEINYKCTYDGSTVLMMLCMYSHAYNTFTHRHIPHVIEKIKWLFLQGVDINTQNTLGYTALMLAAAFSSDKIIIEQRRYYPSNINRYMQFLIGKYLNDTFLYCKSSEKIVKLLTEYGADPNIFSENGMSALIIASQLSGRSSSVNTVKILLDSGANPNGRKIGGHTALMMTTYTCSGENDVFKILLDAGADPNIQDDIGYTALMLAVWCHNRYVTEDECSLYKIVQTLLIGGADPNIQDNDGNTALFYADGDNNIRSLFEKYSIKMK